MDLKTSDQPRWIVVLSAVVGLAATVVSIYTSITADQLKTNAAELESRLKLLEVELKTVDQRTSLGMKLFEKVEATLTTLAEKPADEATRRKRYRATSALVGGMKNYVHDDSFINGLLEALTLDAQSSVAQEEIREIKFDAGVSEREAPPPKPPAGGKESQSSSFDLAPVADRATAWFTLAVQAQGRTELNLAGVAVDVFYCTRATDDLGNAARKERAKVIYDQLLGVGSRGRLRLRELPEIVNKRTGYDVKANQVRYEPGSESKVAAALAAWANQLTGAGTFKPYEVTEPLTPGYLSLFVCS